METSGIFFHYIVDKTICLTKGISAHMFNAMTEEKKDHLRGVHDPLKTSRDNNPGTLQQIEHERNNMRINYYENLSDEHSLQRHTLSC